MFMKYSKYRDTKAHDAKTCIIRNETEAHENEPRDTFSELKPSLKTFIVGQNQ